VTGGGSGVPDPLDRVPPLALVVTGIVSVQFGAALSCCASASRR
jgi:hypothetical protein